MSAPLAGLKVVELARILAGPWIGQTLADLGAEVIKVESPEGDDTRRWGPPFIERPLPDGGTETKPVGLVWISVRYRDRIITRDYHFRGNRAMVRRRTVATALNLLRRLLLDIEL